MENKYIVFSRPNVAEIVTEELRPLNENEVRVKLAVSTISSGTERANLVGNPTVSLSGTVGFPRRSGYSSSGVIDAVGSAVKHFKTGDRVSLCGSTHSQYVITDQSRVHHIGDIPFEDAALFHISIFPLAAIRKCHLEIGESAIVMGMGVLGIVALNLLKAAGAAPVIAVDPNPVKRQKALACGADYALDPYSPDFADTAKKLTNGGANVGIEVTGIGKGLDGILDCMARFGRVALLGCTRSSDFTIDYYRKVHGPGITLVGAHTEARPKAESSSGWWTQADDMLAVKKLTELKRLQLSKLVDEVHSPSEAAEIYTRLANENSFPIVQFDWRNFQ